MNVISLHRQNETITIQPSTSRLSQKKMNKWKYYNRLIINTGIECADGTEKIFLGHSKNIEEVVYNDGSYTELYEVDDSGYMDRAGDVVSKKMFDDLYEEYDETCDKGKEVFMFENYRDEAPMPYVKAEWDNHEHYLRLESEHGINTDSYDVTNAEIIEGVCYIASGCEAQDYPNTEHQNFFKFVAENGKIYYVKETHPFFIDDHDYTFEIIEKEDFDEYDDGTVEE